MKEDPDKKWGQTSLLANNNRRIRRNLMRRDRLMRALRTNLQKNDFIEVDTPILRYYEDPTDNPAFVTLGPLGWPRLHLRTCPEEYTRRCACVYEKAFEVGKCFRNERIVSQDGRRIHLPEFTMVEIYEIDADLKVALNRIEDVVRSIVRDVLGGDKITYQGTGILFGAPFRRLKVLDSLIESGNREAVTFAKKHAKAKPRLIPDEPRVLHELLDKHVKPALLQPTFLTHFPKSADYYPDRLIGNEVQRAELVIGQMEVGEIGELQPDGCLLQGHSTSAIRARHGEGAENHLVDEDYIAEIRAFNRPVGGGAIGIDRLLQLLCDTTDIREVVWYPFVGQLLERTTI